MATTRRVWLPVRSLITVSARKAVEFDANASVTAYTMWDNFRDPVALTRLQSHMRLAGLPE